LTLLCAATYNRAVPLYEYECQDCHFRFEKLQRLADPPPPKCPECGGKISQLLSAPAVQFKGSGWYVTDYARKGSGDSKPASKIEGKTETKPETKTETKPETKPETKSDSKPAVKTTNKKS
jgi:putative FmdB family regulatory protein